MMASVSLRSCNQIADSLLREGKGEVGTSKISDVLDETTLLTSPSPARPPLIPLAAASLRPEYREEVSAPWPFVAVPWSFVALWFLLLSVSQTHAQRTDHDLTPEQLGMTPATRRAIANGLDYLISKQREDGSFEGSRGANTGIVSFAVLSFMATGQMPGQGPRGEAVARSVAFVANHAASSGLIVNVDDSSNGAMYEHAMSVLMLAEVAGEHEEEKLMRVLHRGVELIVAAQNDLGGWRYRPNSRDADISVTVMQMAALRAARDAGVTVPARTMDMAIAYVKKCATPGGGFLYHPGTGEPAYARTAAGVCGLLLAGQFAAPEVRRGVEYLQENKARRGPIYPFYGLYYASHAMYLAPKPQAWNDWFPPIRDELVASQKKNGSWDGEAGPLYGTGLAVLTLAVPLRYLPVFQR